MFSLSKEDHVIFKKNDGRMFKRISRFLIATRNSQVILFVSCSLDIKIILPFYIAGHFSVKYAR
jgi:hypothetical protein